MNLFENLQILNESKDESTALYISLNNIINEINKNINSLSLTIKHLIHREECNNIELTNEQLSKLINSLSNIKDNINIICMDELDVYLKRFESELNKKAPTKIN